MLAAVLSLPRAPDRGVAAEGALWQQVTDGLQGDTVVDLVLLGSPPLTVRSMVLLSQGAGLHRYNSETSGWDPVYADPDRPSAEVLVAARANDDVEGTTLYAGLRGLKRFARSEDSGRNWTSLPGPTEVDRLDRLAVSQGSGRVYVARSDRFAMWTANDKGLTWDRRDPPGPPVAEIPIDDLFAAPDDPYVYMVRGGRLYGTNDEPETWTEVLGPNPTPPVTSTLEVLYAAVGPRGRLHAAGRRGEQLVVMSSEDRGVTWNAEGWPDGADGAVGVLPTVIGAGESRPGVNALWLGLEDGRVFGSETGGSTWFLVASLPLAPSQVTA
ncbi:MAG: hypothetical protein ACK2T6_06135, partial [Anaerolineae bacterium]